MSKRLMVDSSPCTYSSRVESLAAGTLGSREWWRDSTRWRIPGGFELADRLIHPHLVSLTRGEPARWTRGLAPAPRAKDAAGDYQALSDALKADRPVHGRPCPYLDSAPSSASTSQKQLPVSDIAAMPNSSSLTATLTSPGCLAAVLTNFKLGSMKARLAGLMAGGPPSRRATSAAALAKCAFALASTSPGESGAS